MAANEIALSFECTPVRELYVRPDGRSPAEAVVEAISELDAVEPTDLPPLYESVDVDALDRVVEHHQDHPASTVGICFTYHGWNVFVRGDGRIVVGDPDHMAEPTPLF